MKKYFVLTIALFVFFSCSKEEEKLELFSAEAFAYSLDNGWELNASCRVKGFTQSEVENQFNAKLSFTVDLQTPDGKLFAGIGEGLIDQKEKERFSDIPVETQIQIDSTYKPGKYILIINVNDDLSGKNVSIKKEFELTN